jgi:hypothetical protein
MKFSPYEFFRTYGPFMVLGGRRWKKNNQLALAPTFTPLPTHPLSPPTPKKQGGEGGGGREEKEKKSVQQT